ncbi:hypothetical protein GGQ97_002627 [Sphingomonas kaistensis]|uniref:Histidine kinase n=1 Tax=Sphingomonas kaistensis TaxID=298708 RepID=A0A7X6BGV3_9SPHN|nr:hypothetical protein [Sphingomonas kaistensis]NJC06834.1 hypothetical protein [Sphingomonas kaistensis]
MTLPLVALLLLAVAIASFSWRYLKARDDDCADEARLGLAGRRLVSVQQICRQAAAKLDVHVVYLERTGDGMKPVAGVPWPVHLEIIDTMAIDACMKTGEPAGIGSSQHGASDWLFVPLRRNGSTVAVAGVAGPYCRRRLEPEESGIRSLRRNFERFLAEHPDESERIAADLPGRLGMRSNGQADAA